MTYNFMRPVEICRIRIKDIDVIAQTVTYKSKTKGAQTKIIPKILFDELPDLSNLDSEAFLFTPKKIGGYWDATEINRRDYFSKLFKYRVKKKFKLNENQTMYGFRHTFIAIVYKNIRQLHSPHEAKSILMQITGHASMTALEKYLRLHDAELPEDYSNYFKPNS